MVFLAVLVFPAFVSAATAEELQAQINALMAQITQLQKQLAEVQGGTAAWCHTFNANLKVGDAGSEVENLVTVLEKEGFEIDNSGRGDLINVTLEESIASAVSGFQQKYADEILKPAGLRYGTGYVGKLTRTKLNQLYGCGIKTKPQPFPCPAYAPPPPDFCTGGDIVYPEKDENSCFRPPKCILPTTDNQPPVIHGVAGPTTLGAGETGTWVIKAYDPENGPLTYDVVWGDTFGSGYAPQTANLPSQTATFTHSYSRAGTYNPTFIVTDSSGFSAKTSISVNVGITPAAVSEQVKCVFHESKTEQKCYSSNNYTCSGTETCVVDVRGAKGEQVTWKSSCGGYAYTIMDGQNEYAEFKCAATTIPIPTIPVCIQIITPAKNPSTGECVNFATPCEVKTGWEKVSSCPLSTTLKPMISPSTVGIGTRKFRPIDPSRCPGTIETSCTLEPANIIKVSVYNEKGVHIDTRENNNSGMAGFLNLPYGNYTVVINAEGFEYYKASFTVCATCEEITTIYLKKISTSSTTPSITVLSPNGGESWTFGNTYGITWKSSGVKTASVYLWFSDGTTCKLADVPAENGKYSVQFAENQLCATQNISIMVTAGQYRIKIYTENEKVDDSSDNYFSIVSAGTSSQPDAINQMANTLESARTILNLMAEFLKNR